MATSYYIIKMMKNSKNVDFDEYYSTFYRTVTKKEKHLTNYKCRVCLKEGSVPINGDENADLCEALCAFGDIDINEKDNYPKHLCDVCYKFIKGAILFRKIVKETNDFLKQSVKEETFDQSNDSHHDYSDNSSTCETKVLSPRKDIDGELNDFTNLKIEKQEKEKYSPKVTCHVCNKVINRSYYKEHITMHDPNHPKYVCDVCGKSFRLRCAYHNHSLRHRNDFPYKCQFCPYRGRYSELLKTHMRTHTGDYRYMCTECPARFLFKSNLNSHMLKHKEPQFKCDSCKRAFHTKLMLQRHFEADHLGIKNHVCNMCGKAFGYRNAMMKHQRHVHKREKSLYGRMPSYLEAERKHQSNNL